MTKAELQQQLKIAKAHENLDATKESWKAAEDAYKNPEKTLKDFVAEAQEILDKMYTEFKKGGEFLERVSEQVQNHGFVMSPIGRRRSLYRVFAGKRSLIAAAGRRAKNSPIQGISSEIGGLAAYLILRECAIYIDEHDLPVEYMPKLARIVHDAVYVECRYEFALPFIHIMQYMATYGVAKYLKEELNFEMLVEPEIEMEFSASEDKGYKWGWELPGLVKAITSSLEDQEKLGNLPKGKMAEARSLVFAPWKSKSQRKELQSKYPILGVADLHAEIREAVKEI